MTAKRDMSQIAMGILYAIKPLVAVAAFFAYMSLIVYLGSPWGLRFAIASAISAFITATLVLCVERYRYYQSQRQAGDK